MTALVDRSGAYIFTDTAQRIKELVEESQYALCRSDMVGWMFSTKGLPNYLKQMNCYDVVIKIGDEFRIVDLMDFGHAYFDTWNRFDGLKPKGEE